MKILELIRLEEGEEGTFGVLKIDKQVFCTTLVKDGIAQSMAMLG